MTSPDQYVRVAPGPRGRTIELSLNRPERGNAIDMAFAISLHAAAKSVRRAVRDDEADCVLLTAQGRFFCVGGDLNDFPSDPVQTESHLVAMSDRVHDALAILLEVPVPVVARVHGTVAGAGIGLAAFADIVVAADHVRFRSAYPAVGLSPDCGISWLLPRLIGERRAFDLLLSNRRLDAAEAQAWGLVSRVVAPAELDAEIDSILASIELAGRESTSTTKRLIRAGRARELREQLVDEGRSIAALAATDHSRAARENFLNADAAVSRSS